MQALIGIKLIALIIFSYLLIILQWYQLEGLLEWQREQLNAGQWWRIITGNLIHTNVMHLTFNLLGLYLIIFIFRNFLASWQLIKIVSILCLLVILTGISTYYTSIQTYLGFSGVLHALFAFLTLQGYFLGKKVSVFLIIGLFGKILYEQYTIDSLKIMQLIDAPVAIEVHLVGALSGLSLATAYLGYDYFRQLLSSK